MATLAERIERQIADLQTERTRIETQAAENLAAVDVKLTALRRARAVVTPTVEQAYTSLVALGIVKEI